MGVNELINIGSKIKAYRISKGISQTKMAELLNINRSTYSNYENDNREPDGNTIKKISRVLEIPLGEFFPHDFSKIEMNISFERVDQEISISEFAKMLSISRDELLDYECGIKTMSTNLVIRSAIMLGLTLLNLAKNINYHDYFDFVNTTKEEVDIILNTRFKNPKTIELLKGKITKEDYVDLIYFMETRNQYIEDFDIDMRGTNNINKISLSLLKDLYMTITSIEIIDEKILLEILNSNELTGYLEFLYYKRK